MKLIPLTKGMCAQVDDDDYEWLSKHKWYSAPRSGGVYVARATIAGRGVRMHRAITKAPSGMDVDHSDGNPLNNQKHNLRVCTRAENNRNNITLRNRKGFIGVVFVKKRKKFRANIGYNNKVIGLGYFSTREEAMRAYDAAAKIYHGEFATLNYPEESPRRGSGTDDEAGR